MDYTVFEQLIRYVLMAIVVTGSFGLASGIVVWSIKGYLNMRTKMPRVACAYITMSDLIAHCDRQCGGMKEIMETKFDAAIEVLAQRLKIGDKMFTNHRMRLRELEQSLTVRVQDLAELHRDLRLLINEKTSGGSKQAPGS